MSHHQLTINYHSLTNFGQGKADQREKPDGHRLRRDGHPAGLYTTKSDQSTPSARIDLYCF